MEEGRPLLRRILDDIVLYLLWAVIIVAALVMLLRVRALINIAWIALTLNRWTLRAIDRFGLLILGIIWLAGIILAEAALRDALERNKLYIRFLRIIAPMAAVAALVELLLWVLPKLMA